jgi:hypothetical protein
MEVRREKTKDFYETVSNWWRGHSLPYEGKTVSFPVIPEVILPENVFVLSEKGVDLYSVFFYQTDSALGYLAYPARNPKYPKKEGALPLLFKKVEEYAREKGFFLLFTTSPIANVQDALLESGFVEGDIQVTQYFKQLPSID